MRCLTIKGKVQLLVDISEKINKGSKKQKHPRMLSRLKGTVCAESGTESGCEKLYDVFRAFYYRHTYSSLPCSLSL